MPKDVVQHQERGSSSSWLDLLEMKSELGDERTNAGTIYEAPASQAQQKILNPQTHDPTPLPQTLELSGSEVEIHERAELAAPQRQEKGPVDA